MNRGLSLDIITLCTMTFRLNDTAVDLAQNYNFEITSDLAIHCISTRKACVFTALILSKAYGKYCALVLLVAYYFYCVWHTQEIFVIFLFCAFFPHYSPF